MSNDNTGSERQACLEHISAKERFIFAAYFGDSINVEILSQRGSAFFIFFLTSKFLNYPRFFLVMSPLGNSYDSLLNTTNKIIFHQL